MFSSGSPLTAISSASRSASQHAAMSSRSRPGAVIPRPWSFPLMTCAVLSTSAGSPSTTAVCSPSAGVGFPNDTSTWLSLLRSNSIRRNVLCSIRYPPHAAAARSRTVRPSSVVSRFTYTSMARLSRWSHLAFRMLPPPRRSPSPLCVCGLTCSRNAGRMRARNSLAWPFVRSVSGVLLLVIVVRTD